MKSFNGENVLERNRITRLFSSDKKDILSIYFTAGYPELEATVTIIEACERSGVDLVEIGIPFSDPVADGPTIQKSNKIALDNGMSVQRMFEQLENIRNKITIPIIIMTYLNPVYRYSVKKFCAQCSKIGIDGLIIPDLPLDEFEEHYLTFFDKYELKHVFLVTPETSEERVREIDRLSSGFIYLVSSSATTGAQTGVLDYRHDYFQRINKLDLNNPKMIGFGISDRQSFDLACKYASGAIIGSAFIEAIGRKGNLSSNVEEFINKMKGLKQLKNS